MRDKYAYRTQSLSRNRRKAKLAGVCAGIADFTGTSTFAVRMLTVVALLVAFWPAVIGYGVASVVMD